MDDKSILLVEDNTDDVELTLRAFKQNNISNKVVVARDGVEALDPKVDGLEVLKQIRNNKMTRLLPVVILTSSIEENDIITGYKLGANSYVRKPVDFTQFVEAIKLLGLYWLLWNEPPVIKAVSCAA
jgi:two-component system response regulator